MIQIDDDEECDSTDFMTMLREYMRAKGASVKGWILLGNIIQTSLEISINRHNIRDFLDLLCLNRYPT